MSEEKTTPQSPSSSSSSSEERTYWLDNPAHLKKLFWLLLGLAFLLLLIDLPALFGHHLYHAHPAFEGKIFSLDVKIPNFYGFFGFISCVVFLLVAQITRKILMREENYYDR